MYARFIRAAEQLRPQLKRAAYSSATAGELPRTTVDALIEAGLFRLLLPARIGGFEVDPPTFLQVIEELAQGDGSAAWVVSQLCVFSMQSLYLDEAVARTLWAEGPTGLVANGQPMEARATLCEGGYRVSGRFAFSSGCRHASWLGAIAPVFEDGAPRYIKPGIGEVRCFFVPIDAAERIDAWEVCGLRATGSNPFSLQDTFVPGNFSAPLRTTSAAGTSPAYTIVPNHYFAMGLAAVGLGIARSALDTFVETAQTRTVAPMRTTLRTQPLVQQQLGQAEAVLRSARAFLHETVASVWQSVLADGAPSLQQRALLRLASTHAMQEAARAVDIIYAVSGTKSIFTEDALHRCFQDLHVLTQHVQGNPMLIGTVGQVLLGIEVDESCF